MSERLLAEGFAVTVWNRSPGAAQEVAAHPNARAVDTAAEAFSACRTVHSMLADDGAVLDLFSDKLLAQVPQGRVHVNHATIDPTTAVRLARRHDEHGVGYVSAPVLGRSTVISAGSLIVVASGSALAMDQVMPSLQSLGTRTWNLGTDPRLASVVKIAVNYSIISALQSITESMVLAETAGIDPGTFVEILTHTAFSGSAHRGYGPIIAEKRYEPVGFSMSLGVKDLSLASSVASELGIELPLAPVLQELFEAALHDPKLAELDWSAVAEVTRGRRSPR